MILSLGHTEEIAHSCDGTFFYLLLFDESMRGSDYVEIGMPVVSSRMVIFAGFCCCLM